MNTFDLSDGSGRGLTTPLRREVKSLIFSMDFGVKSEQFTALLSSWTRLRRRDSIGRQRNRRGILFSSVNVFRLELKACRMFKTLD